MRGGGRIQDFLQTRIDHFMQDSGFSPVGGRREWCSKAKFVLL